MGRRKKSAKDLLIWVDLQRQSANLWIPRTADRPHAWSRCSSGLRIEPILVRLLTKVGFALYRNESDLWQFGRGFAADAKAMAARRFWASSGCVKPSQQTLNCALSVDLLWNQRFRSDKPCGSGPGSTIPATAAGNGKSDRSPFSRGLSNFPEEIRGSFL